MADRTETEIEGAVVVRNRDWGSEGDTPETLEPILLIVSGPDQDGDILLLGDAEVYMSRDTAQALALEILRRLGLYPTVES